MARRVVHNALLLLGADLARIALGLALTVVVARHLGGAELGKFTYMLTLLGLLTVFADLGLSPFYVREAQHDPGPSLMGAVLGIRCLSTLGITVILAVYATALPDHSLRLLLLLGCLLLLLGVVPSWVTTVLRAREQMAYEGATKVLSSLLTAVAGTMAVIAGKGIIGIAVVMVGVAVAGLLYFSWLGMLHLPRPIRLHQPLSVYLAVIRGAWPFASLSILATIYFRIDSVMLFALRGHAALGQYSAAYRVMEAALLLPWMLSASAFPPIARTLATRVDDVMRASLKGMHFLLALAIPAAVFGAVFAPPLFSVLYGPDFSEAAQIFRILVFTLIAVFASSVTSTLISAGPRPVINTLIALVMVGLNIGLNLFLIPRWSGAGAAVATVLTEVTGLVLGTLYLRKAIAPLGYLGQFVKPTCGALLAVAVAVPSPSLALLPVCCVLYAVILWAIRGITPEDVTVVKSLLMRSGGPVWQREGQL